MFDVINILPPRSHQVQVASFLPLQGISKIVCYCPKSNFNFELGLHKLFCELDYATTSKKEMKLNVKYLSSLGRKLWGNVEKA
jgi:hypothetical protein